MSANAGQNIEHDSTMTKSLKVALFSLNGQKFAIPASSVIEIVKSVSIVTLPEAPSIVEGLFNYRGKIIPLLDIRERFNMPKRSLHHHDYFLVAQTPHCLSAIRVDAISDVSDIQWESLENHVLKDSRYFSGIAKLEDGLVLIHDFASFLSDDEASSIKLILEKQSGA
ncbi:MAG: chemotaxis protein CheW [Candidatus Obscuribacterales bacterium]|nr:chemotaxis protein CheW [Candidatus Obscuribacterales bacterium]